MAVHPSGRDVTFSRRTFLHVASSTGALALAGCTQRIDDTPRGQNDTLAGAIDIAGSSTVFPIATAMAERFQTDHPDVEINIQSTGSGGGFANHFCPGRTHFNNASRPIRPPEEQTCVDNGITPVELIVATDALTVIVNNDNTWVDCITPDELATMWSADAQPETWNDVNSEWPDEELELYGPTDASGTYDYFIETILGGEGPPHRQDYSPTEHDRTIIDGVRGSTGALGYLGFAYYSESQDAVTALAIDDSDGCISPSLETARQGEYTPLSRPLFTYPSQAALAEEHIAAFARFWIENSTSTEIIADEVGYVPLSHSDQLEQHDRLDQAIDAATR